MSKSSKPAKKEKGEEVSAVAVTTEDNSVSSELVTVAPSPAAPPAKPKCRVPGCTNDASICGVCGGHYSEILKMIRAGEITRDKLIELGILLPSSRSRVSKLRSVLAEKGVTLAPAVPPVVKHRQKKTGDDSAPAPDAAGQPAQ